MNYLLTRLIDNDVLFDGVLNHRIILSLLNKMSTKTSNPSRVPSTEQRKGTTDRGIDPLSFRTP